MWAKAGKRWSGSWTLWTSAWVAELGLLRPLGRRGPGQGATSMTDVRRRAHPRCRGRMGEARLVDKSTTIATSPPWACSSHDHHHALELSDRLTNPLAPSIRRRAGGEVGSEPGQAGAWGRPFSAGSGDAGARLAGKTPKFAAQRVDLLSKALHLGVGIVGPLLGAAAASASGREAAVATSLHRAQAEEVGGEHR